MKQFLKTHIVEACVVTISLIVIHAFLLASTYKGQRLDALVAGQFGDFIGGYLGTIFLVVSVALLFGSYRDQRATNERVSFESRFFELLKYHRENVEEVGIGEKVGRRVFVSLIREFREALKLVSDVCTENSIDYPQGSRTKLAYMAFYYGVGPNSTRVLREAVRSEHPEKLVNAMILRMEAIQTRYRRVHADPSAQLSEARVTAGTETNVESLTRLSYCPFDGHQSRLAHYFRHLFHLVKYVDRHAPNGGAREYVDLVRAQLTNHEQALLCLNAFSRMGSAWVERGFLKKYELIKNIPKNFFNPQSELDLPALFPSIDFEYLSVNVGLPEENN